MGPEGVNALAGQGAGEEQVGEAGPAQLIAEQLSGQLPAVKNWEYFGNSKIQRKNIRRSRKNSEKTPRKN